MYQHYISYGGEIPGTLIAELYSGKPDGYNIECLQTRTMNQADWALLGASHFSYKERVAVWLKFDPQGNLQEGKIYDTIDEAQTDFQMSWPNAMDSGGLSGPVRIADDQLWDLKNPIDNLGLTVQQSQTDLTNVFNQNLGRIEEKVQNIASKLDSEGRMLRENVSTARHRPLGKKGGHVARQEIDGQLHVITEWMLDGEALIEFDGRTSVSTWDCGQKRRIYTSYSAAIQDFKTWKTQRTGGNDMNGTGGDIAFATGMAGMSGSITITGGSGAAPAPAPEETRAPEETKMSEPTDLGYDPTDKTKNVLIDAAKRGGKVAVACQFNDELVTLLTSRLAKAGVPKEMLESPLVRGLIMMALPSMLHAGAHHFDGFPKREFFMTASALALEGATRENIQPAIKLATGFLMEAFSLAQKNGVAQVLDITEKVKEKQAAEADDAAEVQAEAG